MDPIARFLPLRLLRLAPLAAAVLFCSPGLWSQGSASTAKSKTQTTAAATQTVQHAPSPATAGQSRNAAQFPPSTVVMTINGEPVALKTYTLDLRLLNFPPPESLPPVPRRNEADQYVTMDVLAAAAHKQGIDNDPVVQEQLRFLRQKTLAELLYRRLATDAQQVPESDIASYYNAHANDFVQFVLERLFIPREPIATKNGAGPPADAKQAAEAAAARARNGIPFQQIANESQPPMKISYVKLPAIQPNNLSLTAGDKASLETLQAGGVSPLMTEPYGYLVFKVSSRRQMPLAEARPQISQQLGIERLQAALNQIKSGYAVRLSDEFFAAPAVPSESRRLFPASASAPQPR
jgi:hypothetical protein